METIRREVRQPYALPVNVSVPIWPELHLRQEKIRQFEREQRGYVSQLQQLERETPSPELKTARQRLEAKQAQAVHGLTQAEGEYSQLVDDIAFRLFRKQVLTQELAELPDFGSPMTMVAYQPGQRPVRPKREILSELAEITSWLCVWSSNDPAMVQEARTIREQLAAEIQAV